MLLGSTFLEVAIGLVFVYLLLSSVCSALNEMIESWLKNRAADLERGIRELLDPNGTIGATSIVSRIYDHPLINSLYQGSYERFAKYLGYSGWWRWLARLFHRPNLPSYIPARNFALALMDTILPANSAAPARAPAGAVGSGTTNATPPVTPAAPVAAGAPDPFQTLRDAISTSTIITDNTRKALLALVDAAGRDVSKARENLETWFNSSMDRVSGWYKRRAQIIIFILGIAVTIALNADTVAIIKKLSTDKPLRDSLVAAAETYAKENATPTPTPTPVAGATPAQTTLTPSATTTPAASPAAKPSPPASASPSPSPSASPNASPSPSPSAQPSGSPAKGATASASPSPTPLPECVRDPNSPECKLAQNKEEIKSLGLPIGWSGGDQFNTWPGNHWKRPGGWWDQLQFHWLGWFITAIAISLGAPFWFDLLNKFIVVRSTVKPHEKSPEEKSKE